MDRITVGTKVSFTGGPPFTEAHLYAGAEMRDASGNISRCSVNEGFISSNSLVDTPRLYWYAKGLRHGEQSEVDVHVPITQAAVFLQGFDLGGGCGEIQSISVGGEISKIEGSRVWFKAEACMRNYSKEACKQGIAYFLVVAKAA